MGSWDAKTDREVKARAIRTVVAARGAAVPEADRVATAALVVDQAAAAPPVVVARAVAGRMAPEAVPRATPIAALATPTAEATAETAIMTMPCYGQRASARRNASAWKPNAPSSKGKPR